MDINYIKISNKADLKINRNKLRNRLKNLQFTVKTELDKIEKEEENYCPSNNLGIIGAEGNIIDVLISALSEEYELKKQLENLDEIK